MLDLVETLGEDPNQIKERIEAARQKESVFKRGTGAVTGGLSSLGRTGVKGVTAVGKAGVHLFKGGAKGVGMVGSGALKGAGFVGSGAAKGVGMVGSGAVKGVGMMGTGAKKVGAGALKGVKKVGNVFRKPKHSDSAPDAADADDEFAEEEGLAVDTSFEGAAAAPRSPPASAAAPATPSQTSPTKKKSLMTRIFSRDKVKKDTEPKPDAHQPKPDAQPAASSYTAHV